MARKQGAAAATAAAIEKAEKAEGKIESLAPVSGANGQDGQKPGKAANVAVRGKEGANRPIGGNGAKAGGEMVVAEKRDVAPAPPLEGYEPRKLSQEERAERERLEERAKKAVEAIGTSYATVAKCLSQIREKGLYQDFETWYGYCDAVFGMSKTHANRVIAAGKVQENLLSIGPKYSEGKALPAPANESQARHLARLGDADRQARVWAEVQKEASGQGKKVTQEMVKAAVDRELGTTAATPVAGENPPATQAILTEWREFLETSRDGHVYRIERLPGNRYDVTIDGSPAGRYVSAVAAMARCERFAAGTELPADHLGEEGGEEQEGGSLLTMLAAGEEREAAPAGA